MNKFCKRKAAILESVGISSSRFDGDDEHEDEDELQIRLLLAEGRDIPDDLLERLKEKNKTTPSDDNE